MEPGESTSLRNRASNSQAPTISQASSPILSTAMDAMTEPLISKSIPPYRDLNSSPSPPPRLRKRASAGAKTSWILIAVASGACAAFNGVFAKLTTTELTSSWAAAICRAFGLLPATNKIVEIAIRIFFFSMNLAFNTLMWALFTAALTRASSTTRVSIINTAANFFLTAFSGWVVFGEKLPGLWWVGAGSLVAGTVIIGCREEEGDSVGVQDLGGVVDREQREGREDYRERTGDEGDETVDGVELERSDNDGYSGEYKGG